MNPLNVPKLCGGDIELGNFFTEAEPDRRRIGSALGSGREAAVALLQRIRGVAPAVSSATERCECADCRAVRSASAKEDESRSGSGWALSSGEASTYNPQDWGRTFLPSNGGCVYIDLDHLEVCLPEVLSARDHVAAWHAMLRIAAQAQVNVNANLRDSRRLEVLANNSDGHGNSYGSHLDFLVTRRAWDNLFHRRLQYLLYLAAYHVSSIVITGQGKVGSENATPPCDYQISQRADFIEVLAALQTTFQRPIVNSRDEALCGPRLSSFNEAARTLARLHVIVYDSNLCHVAGLLKVGVLQIMLAMIEAEKMNPRLLLDDPVAAIHAWSRDPLLHTRQLLTDGRELTAVELQMLFLEEASAFVAGGGCEGIVPEAPLLIELWADTLHKLQASDLPALARRLDWVLKLAMLQRTFRQRPELDWTSPETKHLDHLYSSLDGGLYQTYEKHGVVERVASEEDIERFVNEPPEDTRAWARSRLLRLGEREDVEIDSVDWDEITFRLKTGWPVRRTISLANPLGYNKARAGFLETATLDDALDILGHRPSSARPAVTTAPAAPYPSPPPVPSKHQRP